MDQFEGLYPEGDMPSECEQNTVYVRFNNVNVGARELLSKMKELADPPESLQAELDVSSFAPGSLDRNFRIQVRDGAAEALKPSLWQKA